ncbi:MAG TPA: pyridoxamine 5'-phosphate oxidase [Phycisphaerales bacterium]|nr:pyridoxamine 5'-phosphate oxidase [Phycisphaerales bacterium]HCD33912.1 pyridoxamine 5'-phosphate oxidase [Phycisphaerales bacterium]|tara:strand:- start:2406 stop:2963 length:558 start_codon:yes stop_codon:yes gene_type:complete
MPTTVALNNRQREFIHQQQMFFVGTAPMAGGEDGHINLSPKGVGGTFAILDDQTFAYLDYTGSGIETIAHLRENGRICIMFCAFDGAPNILRIHGKGRVILPDNSEFDSLLPSFTASTDGVRSIIHITAKRINDSCGYGVPLYEYQGQRTKLTDWAVKKGPAGVADYQAKKNVTSLDGLPALDIS